MTIKLKKLRDAARGQSCVACGRWDDSIVFAHLPTKGVADAGMGMKCDDFWGADLCGGCHFEADHGQYRNDIWWRTRMVYRTLRRRFEQGVLK